MQGNERISKDFKLINWSWIIIRWLKLLAKVRSAIIIDKGSFGEVTKAKDVRTNKFRAIKKIKKSAV